MTKENQIKLLFVIVMVILVLGGRENHNKNNSQLITQKDVKKSELAVITETSIKPTALIDNNQNLKAETQINNFNFVLDSKIPEPKLKVKAAIVKDLTSNLDLFNFNTDTKWPLASITKLMSAVIAIEEVGLDKRTIISDSAIATEGIAGNLESGEKYSIGELTKVMILVSSNDAATAIAEFYGEQNFVNKMQVKASVLKMNLTTFVDPTGISVLNQGTIGDMEKLIQYIDKNHPYIFKLSAQQKTKIFEENKGTEKELFNINKFAGSRPDFLGGKTGFTDEANGNLVSLFNYKNHKILIIVFGTDDRFGQTEILYNWVKEVYNS